MKLKELPESLVNLLQENICEDDLAESISILFRKL